MKVTNASRGNLPLPGGRTIAPGAEDTLTPTEAMDKFVRAWIEAGALRVVPEPPAPEMIEASCIGDAEPRYVPANPPNWRERVLGKEEEE